MADPHSGSHGRFVWYELLTTDMAAANAFYAKVVGWGTEDASMPGMAYTLFTVEGISVGGSMGLPADAKNAGVKPGWIGYVSVDDVDAASARVKQLGGVVHVPPTDIPNISRFSVVGDPQMATLVLAKWLRPRREQSVELSAPGHVRWHELFAADWEKAFAFYGTLFGWQNAG
ncbi:MAG: VOC family protein, partial [Xanthobacteraceae bacterium]